MMIFQPTENAASFSKMIKVIKLIIWSPFWVAWMREQRGERSRSADRGMITSTQDDHLKRVVSQGILDVYDEVIR